MSNICEGSERLRRFASGGSGGGGVRDPSDSGGSQAEGAVERIYVESMSIRCRLDVD